MFITSQMGQAISVLFAVAMFTELLMLYCLYDTFKQSPFNWIILVSFTIMMTYLLGELVLFIVQKNYYWEDQQL